MSVSPALLLETSFVLTDERRIVHTREPQPQRGPSLVIIRNARSCAWAVNAALAPELAHALEALAAQEPALAQQPLVHLDRYRSLLAGHTESGGPELVFPVLPDEPDPDIVEIHDERLLGVHFRGWIPGEIAMGCGPVMAICADGAPVSVCFCARSAPRAAEAGVETAVAYRGRGFAGRVTIAWARMIRAQGRIPLYSTSWTNAASLANARKLGLQPIATTSSFSA